MAKLKEELWYILQHLKEDELKHFKWFLEQENLLEGFSGIPVFQLETADRKDTVDLMVQNYQDDYVTFVFCFSQANQQKFSAREMDQ
ncbi:hypothetical protein OYC64_007237 [Pagothenia borchgrevinki]|uniref:Pyrin domain-containing protein n=1 Tax=Pagothenia borchgrevinki TaxID=8213 RepID=A0ABD2G3V4_PAGBO